MLWNPNFKPLLRPVEAFPLNGDAQGMVGLRDRCALSDVVLSVSQAALQILVLMDGEHTCEQIRTEFSNAFDQALGADTLHEMIEHLSTAHLLEGEGFEAYYEGLVSAYQDSPVRDMQGAEALGIVDDSGEPFSQILQEGKPPPLPGPVTGLIVPHLDYARGRPCYANGYATLRERKTPDRVVILGTNHFGRSTSVVATGKDFATPLGTTPCDVDFLERVEQRCGSLRKFELDHAREHSVELQVGFLQHLFGATSFRIVPFLCHDPCGPTGTKPSDGNGVDLREFALALRELIAEDDGDTLVVAGADLSHVGAAFGGSRELDDGFLGEVRDSDGLALTSLEAGDPDSFVGCVAENENPTHICSAGCIFTLATALPDAKTHLLGYHQAVDPSTQTCVTCAAVAYI